MEDFIGFTYNGKHCIKDFGIYRTSDGSRYNDNLVPSMTDKTADVPGGDGQYFFQTTHKNRQFSISIAFDHLTEQKYREMRTWLDGKEIHDLVFDEAPYKVYSAKVTGTPQLKTICFDEHGQRIYKGEGTIQFTCYYPYAHTPNFPDLKEPVQRNLIDFEQRIACGIVLYPGSSLLGFYNKNTEGKEAKPGFLWECTDLKTGEDFVVGNSDYYPYYLSFADNFPDREAVIINYITLKNIKIFNADPKDNLTAFPEGGQTLNITYKDAAGEERKKDFDMQEAVSQWQLKTLLGRSLYYYGNNNCLEYYGSYNTSSSSLCDPGGRKEILSRDGRNINHYPVSLFPNKKEWAYSSKLKTDAVNSDNPGDLPAPFVLKKEDELEENTRFIIGNCDITTKQAFSNFYWNSKNGLVGELEAGTNKLNPGKYIGTSYGTIPVQEEDAIYQTVTLQYFNGKQWLNLSNFTASNETPPKVPPIQVQKARIAVGIFCKPTRYIPIEIDEDNETKKIEVSKYYKFYNIDNIVVDEGEDFWGWRLDIKKIEFSYTIKIDDKEYKSSKDGEPGPITVWERQHPFYTNDFPTINTIQYNYWYY